MSSKYYLRWTDHASTIVEMFTNLMHCNSLVDCTLAAEGQYVKAHKLILSATSPYFQSLFDEACDKHPIIFLKDVKYTIVKAILDYIYSGEVHVSEEILQEFFLTAQSLQIKGLSAYSGSDTEEKGTCDFSESAKELQEFISRVDDIDKTSMSFEEPLTNDDNLLNLNNNSPSLDHQYCAENDDTSSSGPILVSESLSTPCEINESLSSNPSFSNVSSKRVLPMVFIPSTGTEDIKEAKPKVNKDIIQKPKRNVVIQPRNKICSENVKSNVVKKSIIKAPLITSQPSKISQKSGTILISKPSGFTSNLIQNPKMITTNQKQQAVIIGNKILAVPRSSIYSGTKDWLQPPKEKPQRGNEKLYPCPDCKKVFRKPSILSSHRRTHTGEKPYQCPDCGRMFNQSSNFRRHQRTHFEERIRGPNARPTLRLMEDI